MNHDYFLEKQIKRIKEVEALLDTPEPVKEKKRYKKKKQSIPSYVEPHLLQTHKRSMQIDRDHQGGRN